MPEGNQDGFGHNSATSWSHRQFLFGNTNLKLCEASIIGLRIVLHETAAEIQGGQEGSSKNPLK